MCIVFGNVDVARFWEYSEYAQENYVGEQLTDDIRVSIESELGYRLPDAYVELMRHQNGGLPLRTQHRTTEPTSWAEDHVAITGLYGIGRNRPYSLCGSMGSRFWIEEWEYPEIGVYFADCPSAGHDMLCLDYRECGPSGEPEVVHVDQESDYKITPVADTFESFIRGLERDEAFTSIEDEETIDDKVLSIWMDPECGKTMGIESPEGGARKKKAEQEKSATPTKHVLQTLKNAFRRRKKTP